MIIKNNSFNNINNYFKKMDFWTYITLIMALVFAIFLVYPLFSLFLSSFKDVKTGEWTLNNFIRFFTKKYYYSTLINSFIVTISVTLLAVLIGTPLAYCMKMYNLKGKRAIEILIIISMMSPAFIGAYSWILLLGRNGVITKFFESIGINIPTIYGFGGILLVFSLKLYPFIFMYVYGALSKIDNSLLEASESLGASSFIRNITVTIPLIKPTILSAGLIVFMNALADFGTPMLIGEGYRTMPTMIYSEFISEVGSNANFSASMSVIMVIITTIMFIVIGVYGYTTKEDLTKYSKFLMTGLITIIIISLINIFIKAPMLYWVGTILGVVIFSGLIAFDINRIKYIAYNIAGSDEEMVEKMGIIGALNLYLDFINLFLYLLRIFGKKRN